MPDLSEIVKQAQDGSLGAFESLVRQFQDMAVGYAHAQVGDFHVAEDIAQEAFFQTYRDLDKLDNPAAFPDWVCQIVFKHCDRVTRRSKAPTVSLDELIESIPGTDSPEDRLDTRDRNA
jgi:DNA-directed RNA polymerase specialized sigma24 family protein